MRAPVLLRSTHEADVSKAADSASTQTRAELTQAQQNARRKNNEAAIRKLTTKAAVLIESQATSGSPDLRAARKKYRAPIEAVEAFARDRFAAVAHEAGIHPGDPGYRPRSSWEGFFKFRPYYNKNSTNPIPLVSTDAGELAVELGAVWLLNKARYSHQMAAEAAFFARVLSTNNESEKRKEIGYVRLGRLFRRDDLDKDDVDYGRDIDVSGFQGRIVLGKRELIEDDYVNFVRRNSDPEMQTAMLGHVEQAAAAFTILSACVADRVGTESHEIDADAVWLSINAISTERSVGVGHISF